MNDLWYSMVSIATAIVGVAILAVIVSKNADTANVLRAAGDAFSTALGTAVSPVTGANSLVNLPTFSGSGRIGF